MKKALKHGIRKLTRSMRVRIKAGPCEGMLWSLTTRMNFIRGSYEKAFADFIAATLKPDDIFWDVGAHFGYYSLLGSRIVQQGACYAFEPNTDNRWYLEHHVGWNHLKNVTVFPYAVASSDGTRRFGSGGTGGGKLDMGESTVTARSVASLVKSKECREPSFMKIDVEGGESEVLAAEFPLREGGMMCVATHGDEYHAKCLGLLNQRGFRVHDLRALSLLIATRPGRTVSSEALKLLGAS